MITLINSTTLEKRQVDMKISKSITLLLTVSPASAAAGNISGGQYNTAGAFDTVPGGYANYASGGYSFAAGRQAQALYVGSFVWSDANPISFPSTTGNEFSVRATGGTRFVSAIDSNGNPTAGVQLAPGSGSWSTLSDRNLKENFTPTDAEQVLNRLVNIPIQTWSYKAQDPLIRHLGPTAQDLFAAFGFGEDNTHIDTIDIESLKATNEQLQQKINNLDTRTTVLEQRSR